LGVAALQNDKLEDAEVAFRVACRLDPKCARAYAGLAMVAQQRRDYPQSFDLYMKSLELDTNNISALLGLFQVSCEMKSFAKVIYYLEVYLQMHPGDTSVMFALSALYLKDGQAEQAKHMLQDLLVLEPTNRDAVNLLEEVEHTLAGAGQVA
jgi:cytochrome c-type biogenesis protein CcmH/NrfG